MDNEGSGDADVDLVLEFSMIAATALRCCIFFCVLNFATEMAVAGSRRGQIRESIRRGFLETLKRHQSGGSIE